MNQAHRCNIKIWDPEAKKWLPCEDQARSESKHSMTGEDLYFCDAHTKMAHRRKQKVRPIK